jgi:homoserine O-acetyltransferase
MRLAREIGTISYRSGPEWEERFARKRVGPRPSFGPDFQIEGYLDHQGSKFSKEYDPNSLLFISKAMDMFDMGDHHKTYEAGVARVKCPTLILGVQSDMLFPVWQQLEVAQILQAHGTKVTYYELRAKYGHDTFLIDIQTVGAAVKGHLEALQI